MTPGGPLRDPSRGPAPIVPLPPTRSTPGASDPVRPTGALAGRTVLVPRSQERAAALATTLRAAGARVLVSPAIERAPVEDTAPVDDAVARLARGRFDWVVVTSVNAIDELVASAARQAVDLPGAARRSRWAAVGPATRRALEAVGIQVDLEPPENSARGLVAAFATLPGPDQSSTSRDRTLVSRSRAVVTREDETAAEAVGAGSDAKGVEAALANPRPTDQGDGAASPSTDATPTAGPDHGSTSQDQGSTSADQGSTSRDRGLVLLPQGDLAAPTMQDGLTDLGYDPHVVTVYRTVTHALAPEVVAAWNAGVVDAVVLTSGSVAREIARQLGPRDDVAGVAIGDPTARAARAVGLRLDAVADRPTDDALAAALTTVLSDAHATPVTPWTDTGDEGDPS